MLPTVSIIIPFYNCPYIHQAIKSALQQRETYPNVEIVVVDDGSTRNKERILPYIHEIRYVQQSNRGTAGALNTGLKLTTGKYVGWLSSDDLFYPDKIAKQMAFMQVRQAEVSYSNSDLIDANGKVIHPFYWPRFSSTIQLCERLLVDNPINGCTVIMHREVIDRIGGFDESLMCTQDMEFWIRILLAGIEMHYLDESLNQYRAHDNTTTKRQKAKLLEEMSTIHSNFSPKLAELIASMRQNK
jgi:teichuronic acid biosynthesis glycosyltransferase TuaG